MIGDWYFGFADDLENRKRRPGLTAKDVYGIALDELRMGGYVLHEAMHKYWQATRDRDLTDDFGEAYSRIQSAYRILERFGETHLEEGQEGDNDKD